MTVFRITGSVGGSRLFLDLFLIAVITFLFGILRRQRESFLEPQVCWSFPGLEIKVRCFSDGPSIL